MINAIAYLLYLLLALLVVIVVGAVLYRNGRFYLVELFGNEKLADAVNRFLYTGYCLLNIGGAFNCLVRAGQFSDYTSAFEYVMVNQGQLLLLLGGMHAFNLAVLPLLKKRLKEKFYHPESPAAEHKHF